jgi:hypothetical protein
MKKSLLLIIATLGLSPLFGQAFSAYIVPQFQNLSSSTFKQFRSSYNTRFVDDLDKELSPGLGRGMVYGISFGTLSGNTDDNPFVFGFEYSRTSQMHRATFNDAAVRSFKTKNNVFAINMGLDFGIELIEGDYISHYLFIRPEVGLGLGSSKIIADFKSGTSGKTDLDINGTYKTTSGNAMVGIGFSYLVGYVGIKFYTRYNTQFFATGMHNPDRETGEDRLYMDVRNYNSGIIGDEVRNDFKYLQFGIGLVIGASANE